MQTILAGVDITNANDLIGLLLGCGTAYLALAWRSLNKSLENERVSRLREIEIEKSIRLEEKEQFRDYKRDTAVIILELINCKNESNSRLDVIERDNAHLQKDHDKNHGLV